MSAPIERAADEAERVFGWQHLQKYAGMGRQWMRHVLIAIIWSAFESIDTGELARVIGQHNPLYADECKCGWRHNWSGGEFWIDAWNKHVARAVVAHLTKGSSDE